MFLAHVHFGWATEPVKGDLQKLLPGQPNFPDFVTRPDNQHWHAFSPVLGGKVFHWYSQASLTQTQITYLIQTVT